MSLSSQESNLIHLREALIHLNTQFCMIVTERRNLSVKIQEMKKGSGRFSHFDPEREVHVFNLLKDELRPLSLKELLAFSLIMEDQAMALAPGSYPQWSKGIHLVEPKLDATHQLNPILLKVTHPDLFSRLVLIEEFGFLKDL